MLPKMHNVFAYAILEMAWIKWLKLHGLLRCLVLQHTKQILPYLLSVLRGLPTAEWALGPHRTNGYSKSTVSLSIFI